MSAFLNALAEEGTRAELIDWLAKLYAENLVLEGRVQALLDHCPDAECMQCGIAVCPQGEPLHFHHDGCPACAQREQA